MHDEHSKEFNTPMNSCLFKVGTDNNYEIAFILIRKTNQRNRYKHTNKITPDSTHCQCGSRGTVYISPSQENALFI